MQSIRLITFDVTGTLLHFRTPVLEKYVETGHMFGIKSDSKVLGKNFKETWKKLNKEHPNFGKNTGLTWQDWWGLCVENTFSGFIKQNERNKLSAIIENLIAFHSTKEAFTKRPGTDDLLNYLKTKSICLGVISNYDPRLLNILESMDLKKYFNFVLTSYEFGYSKPDVKIFEEALRLGECALGTEAIHIGDDVENDYLGAKKAGLRSFLMSSDENTWKNRKVDEDEVFEDFFKLKAYFQKLNKTV